MPEHFEPVGGESAEQYIERVGAEHNANLYMRGILEQHFGVPEHKSKAFALKSRSFWEMFLTERALEVLERGGSRYAAIHFARRKVDWPDADIEALVDSVGQWKK